MLRRTFLIASLLLVAAPCTKAPDQTPARVATVTVEALPPPSPTTGATETPALPAPTATLETLAVTNDALLGAWAKVLTGMKTMPFFWLEFSADGTFAVTTNKENFDTDVTHLGTYALENDTLTLTAGLGSVLCDGQTAAYKVQLYGDGTLELENLDVPCLDWLNMAAGRLGESEIWVKLPE